jgi:hypothetical protein
MTAESTVEQPAIPAQDADGPSESAPFGYMTDPNTGEVRPKKRPGRRPKAARLPPGPSPSIEELQSLGSLAESSDDTPPGEPPKRGRKASMKSETLPPFRAGSIAKGMNSLYRRAGRIVRIWDVEIGSAIIATTQAVDDDDSTVGDAWEALAKSNPRIRAFLLKLLTGGAWSAVVMAHMPIFMAIAMKPGIRERIPFMGLAQTFLTDEEPTPDGPMQYVPSDFSQMLGGINPDDMAQMMSVAQTMMGQAAMNVPRPNGTPRGPVASHPDQANAMEHPADMG